MSNEDRPDWLKPNYNMHVLANKADCEHDMGTANNTFAEMLSAIGELIERNPDATSWVFTIVNKNKMNYETPDIDELARRLRDMPKHPTYHQMAIMAFKFFRDMSKKQVIDTDILDAILHDSGVS